MNRPIFEEMIKGMDKVTVIVDAICGCGDYSSSQTYFTVDVVDIACKDGYIEFSHTEASFDMSNNVFDTLKIPYDRIVCVGTCC